MSIPRTPDHARAAERGNMLFMILIAVVLIGVLTAVIMNTSQNEGATIDNETLAIRASEAQRYASEVERAVLFIIHNGKSESDLRFAHPDAPSDYGDLAADTDKTREVFDPSGGGAAYGKPPEGVNDGSPWEFYGGTSFPSVGSDRADLVAVLPNVNKAFCDKINQLDGQPTNPTPEDSGAGQASGGSPGGCVNMGAGGRFGAAHQFYETPNTMDASTFTQDPSTSTPRPALEACVHCAGDNQYHFYHVLMAR